MMDMEYNRTSPFISNCLHYSSEFHPYVGEFFYICSYEDKKRFGIAKPEMRFPFTRLLPFAIIVYYSNTPHEHIDCKNHTLFSVDYPDYGKCPVQ